VLRSRERAGHTKDKQGDEQASGQRTIVSERVPSGERASKPSPVGLTRLEIAAGAHEEQCAVTTGPTPGYSRLIGAVATTIEAGRSSSTIDDCDYYVVLVAGRYGSIDVSTGLLTPQLDGARVRLSTAASVTGRGVWRGDRHLARLGRRSAVNRDFVVVAAGGVVAAAQRDRDGCTAPDCRGTASRGSSVARELSAAQPAGRRLWRAAGREGVRARHAAEGAAFFVDANVASTRGAGKKASGHPQSLIHREGVQPTG
jgi:hypothetical protein